MYKRKYDASNILSAKLIKIFKKRKKTEIISFKMTRKRDFSTLLFINSAYLCKKASASHNLPTDAFTYLLFYR